MRAVRWLLALSLVAAVAVPTAGAQVSIGAAGLYASLSGSDFDGTDAGIGGDAQVRFHAGRSFTVGGGVQFTSHDNNFADGNISVLGIFAEPRYHIAMSGAGAVRPYIGARVGYVRESATVGGLDGNANGWLFGGGGGILFKLNPTIDLDIEVLFASLSFGDAELGGTTISGSDASGTALSLRAGLQFGVGGGSQ